MIGNLRNGFINSATFDFNFLYFLFISFRLEFRDIFSQQKRKRPIILLSLFSRFVHEFDKPLNDWKNSIYIQTLKLEGLERVRTLHFVQGVANDFRNFDFLSDLHFIIVLNLDLKVGWSDAPSDATCDFIEGFEGGDANPEVSGEEQYFIDFVETGIVFGIVVDNFGHGYEYGDYNKDGWGEYDREIKN